MTSKINVDIRYADGRIFQCPMPTIKEAREFAGRIWGGRDIAESVPDRETITGVMVTRWDGANTVTVLTYGEAFTY